MSVPTGEGAPFASPEQAAAIEEEGVVFVSAGAGTGKTTVLVERYLKAVCERGLGVDSVLVITYTERAAGELRTRIRGRLRELGRRDLAGEIDRAWISTIHGFCARLLRAHPFEAGLDPRFRVLDEAQARVLAAEAFDAALARFCAERALERVRLLATYGARGLRSMLTGAFERLRSAGRPLELALGAAADESLRDSLRALAEAAASALEGCSEPAQRAALERLRELAEQDASALSPQWLTQLAAARDLLPEAVAEVERAALEELATRDRALLEELLHDFDAAYRRVKEREAALDFEDLQLHARDLLKRRQDVRERTRLRFRSILVDEFQDTNRLQCELVDLVSGAGDSGPLAAAGPDLFFVGDEFQSIYRFRHADVEVFRERREQARFVLALARNYRSRPEVLAVVNHLFSSEFGDGFEPLQAAGRFPEPLFGPAVEVLVTDKGSYRGGAVHWRHGEARHVARRVRELVEEGACSPGEVVLLFAAGTSAELYEEALREQGLPTYRATGRGYFGQQQVVDLLAYLRLLRNRYDDEALVTVLASPLVGVSNDALVLVRRAARGPLYTAFERGLPSALSARDRRLCEAFRQRFERLVRLAGSCGLERLCERIVAEHDYDLAVLACWDGRRRYANLRKLARLARSFEELRGPDLEGFVRFVKDQESVGAREVEAVAEEEGGNAVRLLTIHAAKGLEFKVVVVCDGGRTGGRAQPDEILCLPDGRFGFRVADPLTGKRIGVFDYESVREAERAADEAESRRLYYVAMTRAIDRLIVSGALDLGRRETQKSPIAWVAERLAASLDATGPVELDAGGTPVIFRVDRGEAGLRPAPALAADEQLELFAQAPGGEPAPVFALPPLAPLPEIPARRVRRLSATALALFDRCPYRFYAERLCGLPARQEPAPAAGGDGLAALEIGDAVHALLEGGVPAAGAAAALRARYPQATAADAERVEALVAAWYESALGRRLAGLGAVRVELPFAFEHDGVLVHGRFDVHHRDGPRALVVDFKTSRLGAEDPAAVVEREYRRQRLVYALAALRGGAGEAEIAYVFLEQPERVVASVYPAAAAPALAAELSAAIASIQSGEFRPSPGELACAGCPVLDRVCAGPRLRGFGGPAAAYPSATLAGSADV